MIVSNRNRNFGLDVVRAIAAGFVVSIHLITNIFSLDISVFWFLAYLGVEIFFGLSGFLIGNILIDAIDPKSGTLSFAGLRRFYVRRWLRTVPLYYTILLINFFAGTIWLKNVKAFDARYLFWLQNFSTFPPRFFGESWSLSIEEWFYLLFPLGIFLLFKLPLLRSLALPYRLLAYCVLFIIGSNVLRIINLQGINREFNIVICRFDAIAYGVCFAVLDRFFLSRFFTKKYKLCGCIGLAMVMLGSGIFILKRYTNTFYILYYPIAGIGIGLCLIFMKQINFLWKGSWFDTIAVYISKISYSIYLNNLLVIYLTLHFVKVQPVLQFLFASLVIILFSALTFIVIEKGFMKFRDRYCPSFVNRKP